MPDGLQSRSIDPEEPPDEGSPVISVCRSCPEKSVFIEAGNTEGWIATDTAVDPQQ